METIGQNTRKNAGNLYFLNHLVNISYNHFLHFLYFTIFSRNFVVIFFLLAFCNSAKLRFPSLSAPLPSFFIESFFVPSRSRLHYLSEFCLFFAEPEIGMAEHQAQAYFRQLISAVVSDEKFFARDF